ncbi:hypothetical protein [Bosea sp. AAP35]|uniref:hypothetical protein n=1 Tax=Bosea sp. AAP35 TaxID=1523417 RepID=UPI000AAC6EB3|nr:hypothetical protein [Bosea sp. AAP35]
MAYILRSLAVIGVIALNSPVHGERSDDGSVAAVREVTKAATQIDRPGAMSTLTAAREAAQILAGLDPQTRQRLMEMTAAAATSRSEGRRQAAETSTR